MPGKWTFLKGKLEPFKQEPGWQGEIDLAKAKFAAFSKLELCQLVDDLGIEKDRLERELRDCNTRAEAVNQLLLDKLETDGDTKIMNAFGTFYIEDSPYCTVEDKHVYLAWIKDNNLEALLNVPWQSTNAQAKAKLEKGEEAPPGLKVFIKSTVRRRRS